MGNNVYELLFTPNTAKFDQTLMITNVEARQAIHTYIFSQECMHMLLVRIGVHLVYFLEVLDLLEAEGRGKLLTRVGHTE